MANNTTLYNAALNGFVSGALAGSYQIDPAQVDYAPIVNQAVIFATAMDAAIATDENTNPQPPGTPEISFNDGSALVSAGTSRLVEGQTIKPQLLQSLCFGMTFQRYSTNSTADNFAVLIAAIKAIYFQTLLSGAYTPPSPP